VAWLGLGAALHRTARPRDAVVAFQRALEVQRGFVEALGGLALALQADGRHVDAVAAFRDALLRRMQDAALRAAFAQSLRHLGRLAEAETQARLAVLHAPDAPMGHLALGAVLMDQGEDAAGLAQLRLCAEGVADGPEAATGIGMVRLLLGDFAAGWAAYQARAGSGPGWERGRALAGVRIAVRPEQGLGDTLNFAHFLSKLADRGALVDFDAPAPLKRFLEALPGVPEGRVSLSPVPGAAVGCALLDLGHLLEVTPAAVPALPPPIAARRKWAGWLRPDGRLRVGLAWSGNRDFPDDHVRSLDPAALAPILAVPNCRFIRVQGLRDEAPPDGVEAPDLVDFADTAGLMANLDVVISVDTAPAHLAGVLHRPVWILLPAMPDWRWQLGRTDSPWYPSARLFRQPRRGDWATPVASIAAALGELAAPYPRAWQSANVGA
jgi:Flp pilus assembly protein TadD